MPHALRFAWRAVLTAVSIVLLAGSGARAQSPTETPVDYILLIDVSGSMRGLPAGSGAVDIFPQVKESIDGFLGQLEPGVRVVVAPFASGPAGTRTFPINTASDLDDVRGYVAGLQANGAETHVYDSLIETFGEYRASADPSRTGVVLVYTDGLDNSPSGRTMADAMREFELERKGSDWVYYSTLGVELSPEDRTAIEAGSGTHIQNPSGTVRPLRIIEPSYSRLDFGSLAENPDVTRRLAFRSRSASGLPPGLTVTARAEVDGDAPGNLDVTGLGSATDTLALGLDMVNPFPEGAYEGALVFSTSDPSVIVAPREVRFRFRTTPARTVGVQDKGRLDLGSVTAHGDQAAAQSSATVLLRFNSEAVREGGTFVVHVTPNEGGPALPQGMLGVDSEPGFLHERSVADGDQLVLSVTVTDEVPPGEYTGVLRFEPGTVEVEGERIEVPWRVEVEARPRSAAEWAVLILGLLAAIALLAVVVGGLMTGKWPFWKTDLLRGRLSVIDGPPGSLSQEIDLSGRAEALVGAGTDSLSDARSSIRVVPRRSGRQLEIRVEVVEGVPMYRPQGETFESGFSSETLSDGDRIVLTPYTLEYL